MTVPRNFEGVRQKVSDMVRDLMPFRRRGPSPEEMALAVHLRGNVLLYQALVALIQSRISARAAVPQPSEPIACLAMVARDRELQWLMRRLEAIHQSPASDQGMDDDEEQPA